MQALFVQKQHLLCYHIVLMYTNETLGFHLEINRNKTQLISARLVVKNIGFDTTLFAKLFEQLKK